MDAQSAKRLVRDLIEAEFSAGFPLLRRVPSPNVWKALAYVEDLSRQDRDALFDVFAERGCAWLRTDLDMKAYLARNGELIRHPAFQRFTNEYQRASPAKYADVRFLREWLGLHRQFAAGQPVPPPDPDFAPVAREVVEAAEPPVTAKAPEVRKAVKAAFGPRFGVKPANLGSGVWNYPGAFDGRPFTLTLHWGTFMNLRYAVTPGHLPPGKQAAGINGVTWEGMLGFGIGHWDFVCEHNLAASVELLGEIVERVVALSVQRAAGQSGG